jgi:hypothetical protein
MNELISELGVGVEWGCGLGGWIGLSILVPNGLTGESTLVTGGHGMCCGVWPLVGFGE